MIKNKMFNGKMRQRPDVYRKICARGKIYKRKCATGQIFDRILMVSVSFVNSK